LLNETRYAYSVGRVRVAESYMFDKNKYERMIGQSNIDDSLSVLFEAGYQEANSYENILKLETQKLYGYLKEISPEPEIFSMFLYKNDTHNIKVLLKDEFSNKDSSYLLIENGAFDTTKLKVMLRDRYFNLLPNEITIAIEESIKAYNKTKNPQIIDILLDQGYYKLLKRLSIESKSEFLIDLACIYIDIANLNAFIRIKTKMEDLELLSKVLVDGGKIELKDFTRHFQEEIEMFNEMVLKTQYYDIIEQSFQGEYNITTFEKECDNYIMKYVRKYKNQAFGIQPLIGYMYGKQTEIRNIRIILVGKINNINSDVIRERLRASYV